MSICLDGPEHNLYINALSILLYKMYKESSVNSIRLPVVTALQETLADYVRRIIHEKGLNYREVARRSGGAVSHGAVGHIVNGVSTDVRKDTLRALARGLQVPEDEIFAAARGKIEADPSTEHEKQELINYYDDLPRECQKDVLALTKALWVRRNLEGRAEKRLERIAARASDAAAHTISGTLVKARAPRGRHADKEAAPDASTETLPAKKTGTR